MKNWGTGTYVVLSLPKCRVRYGCTLLFGQDRTRYQDILPRCTKHTKVSGTGIEIKPSVQKRRVQVSMSCQAYQSVWYGKAGCACTRTRTLVFEKDRTCTRECSRRRTKLEKKLGTGMKLVLSLPKCLLLLPFHDGTNPKQIDVFFCGAC